jgi:integrase
MASLRRFPRSPYWFACYVGPDGRRRQASTKQVDRKAAQKVADEFEAVSRKAARGQLAARQVRKVLADIYELVNPEPLPQDTVRSFFTTWIDSKKITVGHKTFVRYAGIVKEFLAWLGPQGEILLPYLSASLIAKFRDHQVKKHSAASVNVTLACIQTALEQAFDDNLVDVNEASRVKRLPDEPDKPQGRRPFTDEELRSILNVADTEWRGMTLCGLYHGLRLGDVASLRWPNVALEARELRFKTEKTGQEMVIPIAEPFYRYLLEIAGDDPQGPLFPKAFGLRQRKIPTSALSNQFYRIMTEARVVEKRTNKKRKDGPGRGGRRQSGGLGFHCPRHTATTLLKRAGASDVVAREIIGHKTAAVSRIYSHIDIATLRGAIDKMPDFTTPPE